MRHLWLLSSTLKKNKRERERERLEIKSKEFKQAMNH